MDIVDTTTLKAAGIDEYLPDNSLLQKRENIFNLTQKAQEAVLCPKDYGAYNHELRHALAARICLLNNDQIAADHYSFKAGTYRDLVDPSNTGHDFDLGHVLKFIDKVATRPRDVTEEDIQTLQKVGIKDPDIVRLAELNSFMAYQIRLIAGLRLLKGFES